MEGTCPLYLQTESGKTSLPAVAVQARLACCGPFSDVMGVMAARVKVEQQKTQLLRPLLVCSILGFEGSERHCSRKCQDCHCSVHSLADPFAQIVRKFSRLKRAGGGVKYQEVGEDVQARAASCAGAARTPSVWALLPWWRRRSLAFRADSAVRSSGAPAR